MTLKRGTTADGKVIEVEFGGKDAEVTIDGKLVQVTGQFSVYRDGGTLRIPTAVGVVVFPHRFGDDDRTPFIESPQ